jgi:hypothetical protein
MRLNPQLRIRQPEEVPFHHLPFESGEPQPEANASQFKGPPPGRS